MKSVSIYRLGLTGGIASGKSTVTSILRKLGATVIDTDSIAREIVEPGQPAWSLIKHRYGPVAVSSDGKLDRAWLGRRVFSDEVEKEWLEALLHPLIRNRAEELAEHAANAGERVVVFDVPLLFESGWEQKMDEVWTVFIPRELQEERLLARDGLENQEVKRRIDSQWPIGIKADRADLVIFNTGNVEETQKQVEKAWKRVLEKCGAP